MSPYSVLPYFAVIGLVTLLFSAPAFRFLDPAPTARRAASIDGVRGFLALSVMIYHFPIALGYARTGQWLAPTAPFYDQLGNIAVAVFFMITGYLFWQKAADSNGHPDFGALYVNRVFRIAPVYLVAVGAMLVIVAARTGFTLHQPLVRLAIELAQWAALGVLGMPDINGYAAQYVLAGVLWTLRFEWLFYLSLLLTARFATRLHGVALPVLAICGCFAASLVVPARTWFLIALFPIGMLVGAARRGKPEASNHQLVKSGAALACLAAVFVFWSTPFGPLQVILLGAFFWLMCSGATVFGLLRSRAAQRLGHISYSTYLLQGIVLTLALSVGPVRAIAQGSGYWLVVLACALALALLSAASYVVIEKRGIAAGRRFVKMLGEHRPSRIAAHDGA